MKESEVSSKVKKILINLESTGDCVWFERMNSGKVKTEWGTWLQLCRPGTPDFMCIVVNKQKNISVIFIECKSSIGKMSSEQIKFRYKHIKHVDIHYLLISDASKLSKQILNIAFNRVENMEF